MPTRRTKKMLLVAAATIAAPVSACLDHGSFVSGFYGDVAEDGGYDAAPAPGFRDDAAPTPPFIAADAEVGPADGSADALPDGADGGDGDVDAGTD
jgi:hypothetical protein